ncbi:MAG: hypothetical protein WBP47_01165 [Candidatus Promineifilaceae bacterium]
MMSRVINLNNPTKIRNQNRRSIAEILRRLSQKPQMDAEAQDMAASLVFLLREIDAGVKQSVEAWEKRGYWMKAERFLRDWEWVAETAANMEDVIRHEAWDLLPDLLGELFPRFADIQLKTMTRSADLWRGNYQRLLAEPPSELPW